MNDKTELEIAEERSKDPKENDLTLDQLSKKIHSRMQILMSRETPDGFTIEDLFEKVISDLRLKNEAILERNKTLLDMHESVAMMVVYDNNMEIIYHLEQALLHQNDSMITMAKYFGENKGPTNPRV